MRFGEKNVLCPIDIDMYEFRGVPGGDEQIPAYIFSLLFTKTEKVQEHDLIFKSNSTSFWFNKKFHGVIIKNLGKGDPSPISLRSEYSSSN